MNVKDIPRSTQSKQRRRDHEEKAAETGNFFYLSVLSVFAIYALRVVFLFYSSLVDANCLHAIALHSAEGACQVSASLAIAVCIVWLNWATSSAL